LLAIEHVMTETETMSDVSIPTERKFLRMPSEFERYLDIRLLDKYGRVSPQLLADDISRLVGRPVSRQLAYQGMTGRVKARWLREAIVELLHDQGENFWADFNDPPAALEEDTE
jgi:hypothetical protein